MTRARPRVRSVLPAAVDPNPLLSTGGPRGFVPVRPAEAPIYPNATGMKRTVGPLSARVNHRPAPLRELSCLCQRQAA